MPATGSFFPDLYSTGGLPRAAPAVQQKYTRARPADSTGRLPQDPAIAECELLTYADSYFLGLCGDAHTMYNPLLLPEIREMLATGDNQGLAELVTELHPATVAEFLEGLTADEIWRVLTTVPVAVQAQIFVHFPTHKQVELVPVVDQERVSKLLEAMPHDDRADLLQHLDERVVEDLLPLVDRADREDIRKLLSYPAGSAGSVMTTDYASLPLAIPVSEAITRLRQQAASREMIYYIYVLDSERHLLGFVSLEDLILARPTELIRDLMQPEVVAVRVDQDRREAARILAQYDFLALPVVDAENRLVGIITHDDVIDVMVEEATEEMLRVGGVEPITEHYLEAPLMTIWRQRAMWLSVLFVAELFTFTALAHFEEAISQIVALSLFVPLCISTGGNSGSQAATLITRALALGQITLADWWRVIRHEILMGIMLGLTLGCIGFVRAALTPQSVLGNAGRWQLALVIAQAVAIICLWGTLVGSILPLVFKRLGADPGYASSPFVATFVDVTGIVIYFSIAHLYLL